MKNVPNAIFALMIAWVLAIGAVHVRNYYRGGGSADRAPATLSGPVAHWTDMQSGGHSVGASSAPTTIVVFADFQCPFCRKFAITIDSLQKAMPNVRVIEHQYPLGSIHPQAMDAAIAAECAGTRGYATMRHVLFAQPELVERGAWSDLATIAGIQNIGEFKRCFNGDSAIEVVKRDIALGESVGVQGTPWVIMNDSVFSEPPTLDELLAHATSRRAKP